MSVQVPNVLEFPLILYAILKLGAVFNGLSSIFRDGGVEFILQKTESKAFIIPENFQRFNHLSMALKVSERLFNLKTIVTIGTPDSMTDSRVVSFNALGGALPEGMSEACDAKDSHSWRLPLGQPENQKEEKPWTKTHLV